MITPRLHLPTRRALFALPLLCASPKVAFGQATNGAPFSMAVAEGLASGAAGFVAGQIMNYYFGRPDSTPQAIENFIQTALQTLYKDLTTAYKKMMQEHDIAVLAANARAVQEDLALYASLGKHEQSRHRPILDQALARTSVNAQLALTNGPGGLPAYSISISQRIFVIQAFAHVDRSRSITRAFASELQKAADEVAFRTSNYLVSLDPNTRLGALQCNDRSSATGDRFGVRVFGCQFTQDGEDYPKNRYESIAPDSSRDSNIQVKANNLRETRINELFKYYNDQKSQFGLPLLSIVQTWDKIAEEFSGRKASSTKALKRSV